jgi:hypothetical protein
MHLGRCATRRLPACHSKRQHTRPAGWAKIFIIIMLPINGRLGQDLVGSRHSSSPGCRRVPLPLPALQIAGCTAPARCSIPAHMPHALAPLKLLGQDRLPAMVHPASSTATFTLVRTALRAYSCGVCMSSVTSGVGGGLFLCFTCLHVPYSTVTLITCPERWWLSKQNIGRSATKPHHEYQPIHCINAIASGRPRTPLERNDEVMTS